MTLLLLFLFLVHMFAVGKQESQKYIWDPKVFRTIFEKRTPAYSLGTPLLDLAKSIY